MLPLADPLLRVTSTATSSDVLLLSVIITVSEVLLSATKYCDWLSDNTDSVTITLFNARYKISFSITYHHHPL